MTLHLYYKEGPLTRWRKVPIDFKTYDQAKNYHERNLSGTKYKILFTEEEKEIAAKKAKRKQTVKRGLTKTGKTVEKYAKATHKRLKVAGPRHMAEIKEGLGEPPHKTITAYDTTLREIKAEKRRKERELTAEELSKLAEKRAEQADRRRERKAESKVKRKAWKPPASPFGEFELNLDRTPFVDQRTQTKKYETGGPGFKSPFAEVHFNPNVNPFGIEQKKSKRRNK